MLNFFFSLHSQLPRIPVQMHRSRMGVKILQYHLPTPAPVFYLGRPQAFLHLRSSSEFQHMPIFLVRPLLPFVRNALSGHQRTFGSLMTPEALVTAKFNSGISSNRELSLGSITPFDRLRLLPPPPAVNLLVILLTQKSISTPTSIAPLLKTTKMTGSG